MPNNFDLDTVAAAYPEYSIDSYIDSGGFKDVFRGSLDGQSVVIKLFLVESRQMSRRAEREARAMEKVDSRQFVPLVEHFVDEIDGRTTYVIVEDYVPGETLLEKINSGEADLELALNLLESLLRVLQEFENQELVHRDIKPSNIIITPSGEVTLLDVGIVRFQEEESLTPDHADRGPSTPPYAAPEVLSNDKDSQDVRTDLFSSGIVFYEALTGAHPFNHEGMTKPEAIQKGARKLIPVDDQQVKLYKQLNKIYETLTEHQQHNRYRKPEFALSELDYVMEETQ